MKTKEQVECFLADLAIVTLKHGIAVEGCGCCESPFLWDLEEGNGIPVTPVGEEGPPSGQLSWQGKDGPAHKGLPAYHEPINVYKCHV